MKKTCRKHCNHELSFFLVFVSKSKAHEFPRIVNTPMYQGVYIFSADLNNPALAMQYVVRVRVVYAEAELD